MPMTDPLRHGGLEHQIGAELLQALLEDPVGGVRCPGEVVHCVNVPCCSCVLRTYLVFMKRNIFISLRCLVSSTGHSWHCARLLSRLGIAEYRAIFIDSCIVLWPVELVYFFWFWHSPLLVLLPNCRTCTLPQILLVHLC